jgi:DNA-binding MarR family transcriptional regulator
MNPIKQKAPGSNPEPSKTRATASAVPRSNEHSNSGTAPASEQVNRPEAHYLASLAYGEVVEATVSRAQTEREAAFELIDHYTLDLMLKAGLAEQVSLYLLLSEYSSYEEKYGSIRYYSAPRAELAKRLGKTQSTVSRWLSKLEAAGFISTYYQRQTESPGVSRVAGNAYVLEHRQLRGKLTGAAIYQEPVVDTANSEPMTQSTEAEVRVSLDRSLLVSLPTEFEAQRAVLRSIRLVDYPSSSTATATRTTSYPNMTTPLVKNDELVISLRDLDRDLIKPDGKKRKPITEPQIEAMTAIWSRQRKHIPTAIKELLEQEGIENLDSLSRARASALIQELNASLDNERERDEPVYLSSDEVMRRKGLAPIDHTAAYKPQKVSSRRDRQPSKAGIKAFAAQPIENEEELKRQREEKANAFRLLALNYAAKSEA